MLEGKKILLGITGSIAAYKSALLCRLLVKSGCEVKVVMTESSKAFISALTMSTLSGNPALSDFTDGENWNNHVELANWADLMLIAPCSATSMARMASGLSENLLTTTYLSASCPVIVAPAMDREMWIHPTTKRNISILEKDGVNIIPVESGFLASGLEGDGRMAEPENIITFLTRFFLKKSDLSGKKILITAGPTHEPIDPVRYIGNHSTGKMGYSIADECVRRGAAVTLISGPVSQVIPPGDARLYTCKTASEMYDLVQREFDQCDIMIMTAAVADFTPVTKHDQKIKKGDGLLTISLTHTVDIAAEVGKMKKHGQILVGFALESDEGLQEAKRKLHNKNLDCIVLNSLQNPGAGFGGDNNQITIIDRAGHIQEYPLAPKVRVAADIIDFVLKKLM